MLTIQYDKTPYHDFALVSGYSTTVIAFCRMLKKMYGQKAMLWDAKDKKWRFSNPQIIRAFKDQFPDLEILPGVYKFFDEQKKLDAIEMERTKRIVKLKESTDTTFKPSNVKKELYPFQKVGVEFCIAAGGRAIVADSMGLGKTATALAYAAHMELKRVLVVCPASVKYAWEKEVKKWTDFDTFVINSKSKLDEIEESTAQILIINYDILEKFSVPLLKRGFQLCICDESHVIKNRQTKRAKLVRMLVAEIPKVLFLSGTPFLSRPAELFTTLNMLDSRAWKDYYEFTIRYCGGHRGRFGWEAKGATHSAELKERISKYFIRRLKENVLKDLPSKIRSAVPVELSVETKKKYSRVEDDLLGVIRETKGDEAAERASRAEAVVQIGMLRQITTMGKIDAAKEVIENVLDSDEKVIVFSCYNEPLKQLHKSFPQSVLMLGETPLEERQEMVDQFQNDPETKIFFGGIKAAGAGITLTKASNVLFLDYSWTPADLAQAEDRAHRIGAKKTVNVIQLYARDTIDSYMNELLKEKHEIFSYLFDGNENASRGTEWTLLDNVMNMLREKSEANPS